MQSVLLRCCSGELTLPVAILASMNLPLELVLVGGRPTSSQMYRIPGERVGDRDATILLDTRVGGLTR